MKSVYSWSIGVAIIVILGTGMFFFFRRDENELTNFPPKNDTIVAFGDSLVEGVGSTEGNDFVSVLGARLGTPIINLGVAGDTTQQGLMRIDEALEYDPGTVLILLGGNDALRRIPLKVTEMNLETLIKAFQNHGVFIILLGVRGGLVSDPYDDMYEAISEKYKTAYVPNVLSGILFKPELTADQIHPNDSGYMIVADRIIEVIEPLLKK